MVLWVLFSSLVAIGRLLMYVSTSILVCGGGVVSVRETCPRWCRVQPPCRLRSILVWHASWVTMTHLLNAAAPTFSLAHGLLYLMCCTDVRPLHDRVLPRRKAPRKPIVTPNVLTDTKKNEEANKKRTRKERSLESSIQSIP